jgi:cytoskeletal protein CcmA (bactofilin family)
MPEVGDTSARSKGPAPVLAAGMEFCGVLVLPGPARIEGRVRGEVLAGGPLWIGETGVVEADLEGDVIVVAGRVEGDVTATSRIEVRSTATVLGGLWAPRLVLAEGSTVNGPCCCGNAPEKSSRRAGSVAGAP